MKKTFYVILFFAFAWINLSNAANEVKINHDGTNGLVVESDGTVRSDGNATTWADLNVYPDAKGTGSNNPVWTLFSNGVYLWMFANSKEVFFTVQLPHSYKEGTAINPHVHWTSSVAAASDKQVGWNLEYTWANHKDAFGTTTTVTGNTCVDYSTLTYTAKQHLITPLTTITGSRTLSSFLICRLYRSGTDTYATTGDVFLLGVDFHYEMDTQGSHDPFIK
jgi:hypothetical protein